MMRYLIIPVEDLKEIYEDWQYCRKSNDGTKAIFHVTDYNTLVPEEPKYDEEGMEIPREYPYPVVTAEEIDELPDFDYRNTEAYKAEQLMYAKEAKTEAIKAYDVSDEVNQFTFKGQPMWFAKADRVGLRNSLEYEKAMKRTESTMWCNGVPIKVKITEALQVLQAIEIYALECYNTTQQHLAEVAALDNLDDVKKYDITAGYPEKPNFK